MTNKQKVWVILAYSIVAALTGFGLFWAYTLLDMNVFLSMFMGMWLSSVMSIVLYNIRGGEN